MCNFKYKYNLLISFLKLKFINLGKFNIALLAANIGGIFLFFVFLVYPHSDKIIDNTWYWEHVFIVLWALLGILVTALTFVLSIYLPPILKELKDLSIGINASVRHKIIKNNAVSINILQMVMSIIIIASLVLELFCLSVNICDQSQLNITIVVIIYAVITLCLWVMSIWELALIDCDNYIHDCLLLLPTDSKNQRAYYTIVERQLHNHISSNDVYRFNDDLIRITKFIAEDKTHKFIHCKDYCIKPLFYAHNETQYLKSITNTYNDSIQEYSYSKEPITSADLDLPEDNITTFQHFMFSSNSTIYSS